MKTVVSTPYPEASVRAIVRSLPQGSLVRLYASLYGPKYVPLLSVWPRGLEVLHYQLERRWSDIPRGLVRETGSAMELLRIVATRRPIPDSWGARVSHLAKRIFDAGVARSLARDDFDVVIGMQDCSAETLSTAKRLGRLTVLNYVNSHPTHQNRLLQELGGAGAQHPELIPKRPAEAQRRELACADVILVPSGYVARQLIESGVPKTSVYIHPYGVDLGRFHQPLEPPPRHGRIRCLFVGQIGLRKGIPALLAAARSLESEPVDFELAGPMVDRHSLCDMPHNVTYRGPLRGSELIAALHAADVFVYPTIDDSFSLAVLEARACGLPVVTTNHAGSSELFDNWVDGIVVPAGDPSALTTAIAQLVRDPDLRRQIGSAASQAARNLSWESYGAGVQRTIRLCWENSQREALRQT